jgi:hypothetical protein
MNLIAFALLFGSLWGGGELLIWDLLRKLGVGMKSPYVFAYGILILALSRTLFNKRGSSLLIALVAASFKFLGSHIFFCQFIALLLEGLAFEVGFLLLPRLRKILVPIAATYLSYSGFALSITYILKISGWAKRGLPGVLHYIFVNGTLASILSLLTFNLGVLLALYLRRKEPKTLLRFYERYGFAFSIVFFIVLWVAVNA